MISLFRSKSFTSFFVQNFFILCSANVVNVLPDHLAEVGASKTYIGLYMNITSLMMVVLAIPLSLHADRFGRKRLFMWAYATAMVSYAGSFLLPANLPALAALRVAGSLLICLAFTVQTSEVFGLLPRDRRFSGMAFYGISGLAANPIGTFAGEIINGALGARWLFAAAFMFTIAGLGPAIVHRYNERAEEDNAGVPFLKMLKRKELRPLLVFAFLIGGAWAVFATFLVNLTRARLGVPTITGFFASFAAVSVFIRLFLGRQLERLSPRLILSICFPLEMIAFTMAFFLQSAAMLPLMGVIYGIGHSIMYPLISALFVNSGHDGERLSLNNLFSAVNQFGGIAAAVAMGAVADAAGLPVIFILMAALCLGMLPISLAALRPRTSSPALCPTEPSERL